jgi:hypothetical protein
VGRRPPPPLIAPRWQAKLLCDVSIVAFVGAYFFFCSNAPKCTGCGSCQWWWSVAGVCDTHQGHRLATGLARRERTVSIKARSERLRTTVGYDGGQRTHTKSGESHFGWHTGMHGQHGTYASELYAASPRPSLASLRNWCSLLPQTTPRAACSSAAALQETRTAAWVYFSMMKVLSVRLHLLQWPFGA